MNLELPKKHSIIEGAEFQVHSYTPICNIFEESKDKHLTEPFHSARWTVPKEPGRP